MSVPEDLQVLINCKLDLILILMIHDKRMKELLNTYTLTGP